MTGAACCVMTVGVSGDPFACTRMYILSTLRHFDSKLARKPKTGQLIPCERRLAKTEISENQEVTFQRRFENRDYDRPFRHFLVTLSRSD